jgi:RNA polymerase sigma factor (sigma-70 family)
MIRPDPVPASGPETLEEVLRRVRPRLKRVLNGSGVPFEDAEDLLQEALLDALRQWETIRNVEAWLIGALRIKCVRYWRQQQGERLLAVDPPQLEALCEPQPPAQEQEEALLDLRRLTRGLAGRHRAALWLRFGLGLSTAEVAQQLGYCPASVRKLTGRALARLQRWAAAGPEDG